MTTTETSLADKFTTVTMAQTGVVLTVERTACPQLGIGPVIYEDGISGDLVLIHLPTGMSLGRMLMADRKDLQELASRVAYLDWDFADQGGVTAGLRSAYLQAKRAVEFENGEESIRAYPDGWEDDPNRTIPGKAEPLFAWLLAGFEATADRLYHPGGPESIRLELPLREEIAAALRDGDGDSVDLVMGVLDRHKLAKANPHWLYQCMRMSDTFAKAYLVAALRRVAPDVADHAAAWLAGTLEDGETTSEWAYEWRQQLDAGHPLRLPAIPSPEPVEGELFADASAS